MAAGIPVNNTIFVKTARRYPPEARRWPLNAAGDFASAIGFLRKNAMCNPNSAEHLGLLLGAVIAYARPFSERVSRSFNQHRDQRECFMGIAADLGADMKLHCAVLLAREELIASSEPWRNVSGRALGSHRSMRRFAYPNPRCASITGRIGMRDFASIAMLMRLACTFFLTELVWLPPGTSDQ
jgi:hypothetical protein